MSVDPCSFHPLPRLLLTVGSSMRVSLMGSSVECGIPPVIICPGRGFRGLVSRMRSTGSPTEHGIRSLKA